MGKRGFNVGWLFLAAIIAGALLSSLNGLLIAKVKIPAIVATLSTMLLLQGVLPMISGGSIYDLPVSFTWLAFDAKLFGIIPSSIPIMLVIVIFLLVFMKYSKFSKKLYAIGNNAQGARLAGINVSRTIIITYIIAGALYGVTAVIIATGSQRVTPTMANGMEMIFIASVVLGGTSTAGGSGKLTGTVIGALILSIISPAINYMGINSDWSDAVMGAIIILSVIAGALNFKKRRKLSVVNKVKLGGQAL